MDGVLDRVTLRLVDSVDAALELKRWLGERRDGDVLGLDLETTGLSPLFDRVRLVQFGDLRTGWAVPWERWGGVAEEVIRSYEGTWATHNGISFDAPFLAEEGIHLPRHRVEDVMLAAHVVDSRGSLALKSLADQHVDPRASAGQRLLGEAMRRAGWTWETVPVAFEPYWTYGALDAVITRCVRDVVVPRARAEAPLSYDLEAAAAWVTARMSRHGARVDRPYVADLATRLREYCERVEEWCRLHYRVRPGSHQEVADRLVAEGVRLTLRNSQGWVLDKGVLAGIDHPLARAVLDRRRMEKTASTYLEPFLRHSERDGLLHPHINPVGGREKTPGESGGKLGVRTGRMSMDEPNLQNVPVRTIMGEKVRNAVVPRPDHVLLTVDFDQVEMRLFAHMANDAGMIEAFSRPEDFFVAIGREIFSEPEFRKSDPRRQWVKNGGYTKIYGGGVAKLAATVGISEDVAAAFMRRFDALYPGGKRWVDAVSAEAFRRQRDEGEASARSPLTNRRHVADRGREYALVNYLVQGTAAEVLKMKLVQLDQEGVGDVLVLPVHDEVIADVPRADHGEVAEVFKRVMNDPDLLRVPVTATLQVCERWGAKK